MKKLTTLFFLLTIFLLQLSPLISFAQTKVADELTVEIMGRFNYDYVIYWTNSIFEENVNSKKGTPYATGFDKKFWSLDKEYKWDLIYYPATNIFLFTYKNKKIAQVKLNDDSTFHLVRICHEWEKHKGGWHYNGPKTKKDIKFLKKLNRSIKRNQHGLWIPMKSESEILDTVEREIDVHPSNEDEILKNKTIADEKKIIIKGEKVSVVVWDYQYVDGDIVDVFLNDELIEPDLVLSKEKFEINFSLVKGRKNEITFLAKNEGGAGRCTIRAKILETGDEFTLQAKKGEVMKISFSK
ncbi:hypothetical protein COB64_01845 [Candidatus Wolfebacteria bacterium]|nr:MAG: hypothetical protein COB64_01845 [Candidatus Wolfebacteria bacterium]